MSYDIKLYIKYEDQIKILEDNYHEQRKLAYSEKDIDKKISLLGETVDNSKKLEKFCREIGLSKYVAEMYKQCFNSKRVEFDMFKDDKEELKKYILLKKVLNRLVRKTYPELKAFNEYIKN